MLDPRTRRRRKVRNAAQAVLLLGGMVAVFAVLAWLLFDVAGLLWALVIGAVMLALRPNIPPQWVLSMYGARPLPQAVAPGPGGRSRRPDCWPPAAGSRLSSGR